MANTRSDCRIVLHAVVGMLAALAFALSAAAQTPPRPAGQPPASPAPSAPAATPSAPAATPSAPAATPQPPPSPDAYSYDAEGRRDPFVSLLTRGSEYATEAGRVIPEGREGLGIGEVSVRGIVRSRNSFLAMVQGPDNKTYIIHTGDKMLDGVVKAIMADAVVFAQDVNDPLSLVKQREVRKMLRATEEGK